MLYFSSIVLLGKLNPAIFQPQWLDRYKIVPIQDVQSSQGETPKVEEVPIKGGKLIISKTPPMIVSSDLAQLNFPNFRLTVDRDRYVCSTFDRSSYSMIKDLTIKIFSLLNHTPIRSTGINFDAHLEFQDKAEDILRTFFAKGHDSFESLFGKDYGIKGSIKAKLIGDVDTIDLDKSPKYDNSIFVHANFHKNIATENADEAINWIDTNYVTARDTIIKIIKDLLGEPKKVWTHQQQKN